MNQPKLILISTITASLLVLAGCTAQTSTNTNTVNDNANVEVAVNTNISDENGEVDLSTGALAQEDWLTYSNEEYGFSFRYPSDWILNNNGSSISLRTEEVKNEAYLNAMTISITDKEYEVLKNNIENSDRIDDGTSLAQFSDDVLIEDIDGVSAMKGIHATAFGPFMQYYYIPLPNNVMLYIEYFEATAEINNLIEPVINTLQII